MNFSFKNPFIKFLIIGFSVYLCWYILYEFKVKPQHWLDLFVVDNTILISNYILHAFNYTTFTGEERLLGIDGTPGLWIGDKCNGVELFALFSVFVIAYPGSWEKKLWYIPLGIISIQILNILRVVGLAVVQHNFIEWTEFNHTYVFNIIMYGYIFLLWMIWANKLSDYKIGNITGKPNEK